MSNRLPSQDNLSADSQLVNQDPPPEIEESAGPVEGADQVISPSKRTKYQAVKLALEAGHHTAKDAIQWIKEQYRLEVNDTTFNTYRSSIKNKAKKDEKLEPSGEVLKDDRDLLEALRAVKKLMKRLGAEMVKGMVDILNE